MPRVSRKKSRDSLLDNLGEQSEAIDAITSDDGDHISEQSFEEDEPSDDDSSESNTEMDVDYDELENVSLHQRLLDVENSKNCNDGQSEATFMDLNGKNGYKWSRTKINSDRPNPSCKTPGPDGPAKDLETLEQFWQILIPDEIFEKIVTHTNKQIEHVCATMMANDQQIQTIHHTSDIVEIKAFVGLLYYAGLRKDSKVDINNMWDKRHGISVYRCTMPLHRFSFLCSCLRFDDKETRDKTDKLAPIREIWTIFVENCKRCYKMSNKTTVGEQLLSFKGRCPFRVCMKSEVGTNKYGIKLITLNDAETSYLAYAIPYLGRDRLDGKHSNERIPEYLFRKVSEPIHGSSRTVTCNSWFTSIHLIERFIVEPYKLTITGEFRKDRAEIPNEMKLASKRVPNAKYCYTKNTTLVAHTPKKNKVVLVASSYSRSTEIVNGKPEIIAHYDQTKNMGMENFDQHCRAYTVAMRTNRWPMRFFLAILDQAIVNARILFKCRKVNAKKDDRIRAYNCLRDLSMHLIRPYLQTRIKISTLRADLRLGIKAILNVYEVDVDEEERSYFDKRTRCGLCPRKNEDILTKKQCPSCKRAMCDEHRVDLCVQCGGTN